MNSVILTLNWIAGLIVLAEAINKLYVVSPFGPNMALIDRVLDFIKASAWVLLAMAAGGALVAPLLGGLTTTSTHAHLLTSATPSLTEACGLVGFALIIIRLRIIGGK